MYFDIRRQINGKIENFNKECSIDLRLNILSEKWNLKILYQVFKGDKRFNEIKKSLEGITTKLLTIVIRELEDYKVINRKVYVVVPPKAEYTLTEAGEKIIPLLKSLC